MADSDTGSGPSPAPDDDVEAAASDEADEAATDDIAAQSVEMTQPVERTEPEIGRTELKVQHARKTLEEEAEAARRRVLGGRRGRGGPATVTSSPDLDAEVDLSERLRELVRGVEEETNRLLDDVSRLRSAAGRAGATLQEEVQRAAGELAEDTISHLETTVTQTAAESLEALTATIENLQETAAGLNNAAGTLVSSVEQLGRVAPVAEQLAQLASAPPMLPDVLATILRDLTDQLAALGSAVSVQVRNSVDDALATELGRQEARIEHALARLVDELARLRRRLPVTKRGAAVDLSKEQLVAIGKAVGDYLLAAMREQQS